LNNDMRLLENQVAEFIRAVNDLSNPNWEVTSYLDTDLQIKNWKALVNRGIGVAYGILRDNKPAGFLMGIHTEDLMDGKRKAYEILWLVHPAHRSKQAALELLHEFENGAAKAGCEAVVIGCHAMHKPGVMRRWYNQLGYRSISESFERKL
jgi:GNAT superfamily N-acetyltransferase